MKQLDDGRYNKVANIIGHTMQYHPHGDASIGDALVQLGQKDLLIDQQGNWGNILTGDAAAAPRYIEARLSKFALEWSSTQDHRMAGQLRRPQQGAGLPAGEDSRCCSRRVARASPWAFQLQDPAAQLQRAHRREHRGAQRRRPRLVPDFPTGGLMDAEAYQQGQRGGRDPGAGRIRKEDNKTLVIHELPFGATTSQPHREHREGQ
jgi:topoisomerase-4 subunit A